MPRIVGVSSCSTVCRIRRRPSAFTVASCFGESPMMLLTSVTLSFLATGGLLAVVSALAPGRVRGLQPLEPTERVDRGLEHVVRIVRAERLGQDVLDTGGLQHGPDGAAGDDAGPLRGRLQIDA